MRLGGILGRSLIVKNVATKASAAIPAATSRAEEYPWMVAMAAMASGLVGLP